MVFGFWTLMMLVVGSGIWGILQYRRQHRKLRKLNRSLLAAHQKLQEQETTHSQNKASWEQTEEKLRSYLQLLDTLINTIPNPIYFKDAAGVYQGCNKVFANRILGLTRDRIIGKRPQELTDRIPADLAAHYQREERKLFEKACFHIFEAKVQCTDGQGRDFLFSLAPVMDQGEFSGSVAVLSDLTEKNRAAYNRMHKEELEGVLETAGAVCHEFNQPLQALSGYTERMAMKLAGHESRPDIEKLTAQIERMCDITAKLQGITHYETTAYAGNTKIIDLRKAAEKGRPNIDNSN